MIADSQILNQALNIFRSLNKCKPILDDVGVCATFVLKKLVKEAAQFKSWENDGWFYLSTTYICNEVGYAKTTVRRALKLLVERKYIQMEVSERCVPHFKILVSDTDPTAPDTAQACAGHGAVFWGRIIIYIKQIQLYNKQEVVGSNPTTHINGEIKKQNSANNENHEMSHRPQSGKGGGSMRRSIPGQYKVNENPSGRKTAKRKYNLLDDYTQEEIEFVHSWYRYVKTEFEPYFRRDRFKDLAKSWLNGIRAVYAIPRPFCSFEELKNALEWVKTDKTCFYHKNVRSLANIAKKTWNSKNGDPELMLKKLLQEYSEHEKGETRVPQKPNGPIDVKVEIPDMVKNTLSEVYDPDEDYFRQMCRVVSERVAVIWDTLDKRNLYQKPTDRQDWIRSPKCLEKLADIIRLWNKYGGGEVPVYGITNGSWSAFWRKVDFWRENELTQGKPGIWVMDKLQNYFQE